jgi:hypothetical protein
VFERITTPLKVEARDLANFLIIAVALGLSAMIAFVFGAVAVFLAVQQNYGAVYASLAEIGYCLVVTAVMVGAVLAIRSKARRRAVARAEAEEIERRRKLAGAPPMWKDSGVIAAAVPILLKVVQFGSRNKTGIGLVTGGLAAAFTAWHVTKPTGRGRTAPSG